MSAFARSEHSPEEVPTVDVTTPITSTHPPLAAHAARTRSLTATVAIGFAFVVIQALSARLPIQVPGTPIPITLQPVIVLLSGAFLGARAGAATQIAYLGLGALGLPMFVYGGGFLYLFGPTGGYLFGFVMAAYAVGRLIESGAYRSYISTFVAMLFASYIIIGMGSLYLALFYEGDFIRGFLHGGLWFILADFVKVAAAAALFRAIRRNK